MGVVERREREKQAREELILNSARELFDQKGFENVSMVDIANKAELAKGTLYIYFQSKQEILYTILEPIVTRPSKGFEKIANEDGPADLSLKKFLDFLYEFYCREPDFHNLITNYDEQEARKLLSPEKLERLKGIMRKNLLAVAKIVERGIKQEIFRDVNPWMFSTTFWNLFYSTLKFQENRIAAGGKDYRKSTLDSVLDLIVKGLMRS